ncbi:gluconate 2-dehydrogenase subunit 3 family protein [Xanthocytophaga agilis]|uniref:Gluconate 2-dehydrogenase subunit 3 family protein n=1 Tax=Xanthocytophaga agilis TaxID=3048010 RepID=A0AAE3R938_9BACT|nr:gluconate 2-dehydrogenase subunit 3 family protein [Xanthocytophaga agilis]MDJ1505979.1 gluconate 2-dehydrogenase subunit 3 family protein [Xanthocytophaga agilis]
MNRRDAIARVAALMGTTLSAPTLLAVMEGCNSAATKETAALSFTPDTLTLIGEIAETIIPKTGTPGAKEAGVADFIKLMLTDCYTDDDRQAFFEGLKDVDDKSQKAYSKSFVSLAANERNEVFKQVEKDALDERTKRDEEAKKEKERPKQGLDKEISEEKSESPKPKSPIFYFTMKDLTLLGYFTSEVGATQALAYVAIPGRYDGCVDLKPGQKAWVI